MKTVYKTKSGRDSKIISQYKLPKAFKKRWLEALRSGKYKQATNSLYNPDNDGFCCLGVGCAIAGISKDDMEHLGFPIIIAKHHTKKLPKFFTQTPNGTVLKLLANINDENKNFNKTANYIEKYL